MSAAATHKGRLKYGIEYDGKRHFDFEMRVSTVADNILAIETVGASNGMRVTMAMMASALVSLGTIPRKDLTSDLLAAGLVDDDYDTLLAAQDLVKKKLLESSAASVTTATPSSSSDDSVSQSAVSGA